MTNTDFGRTMRLASLAPGYPDQRWRAHLPLLFSATTRNDKVMYVLLAAALLAGLSTTVLGNLLGHPYDDRLSVAPYFRSVFYLHPRA